MPRKLSNDESTFFLEIKTKRRTTKSNWGDIGDLRLPHATWRLGRAARYFESILGLPEGAIAFLTPKRYAGKAR
jgi:hypothetical protein